MSLASDPDVAETVVFDLDPGKPAGMREACTVALVLRQTLELVGLQSFAKTSGSKGLQLYVPLNRGEAGFEDTKKFARDLAEMMAGRLPELVVSNMKKSLRRGKVLIDWSQNSRHKTTVCVYSMRANDPPGISTPVDWREVEAARRSTAGPDPLRFGPDDVADRVDRLGDLFAPVLELKQRLP